MKWLHLLFANRLLTDGFAISFVFAGKKKSAEDIGDIQLSFEDFTDQEIHNNFQLVGVDPGRLQVFTGAYGTGEEEHEIRRVSSREYYAMTGSKRRNQLLQKENIDRGIGRIEQNYPNSKNRQLSVVYGLHFVLDATSSYSSFILWFQSRRNEV